ncbi:hypothetical protein E4U22_004146, partial [Claviceps purpurea]
MEHHKESQRPVDLHTSVLDAPEDIVARGILKIEQFCSVIAPGARLAATWQDFGSLLAMFTTDQMTEMAIRLVVEPVFKSLLSGDLEEGLLNALAE